MLALRPSHLRILKRPSAHGGVAVFAMLLLGPLLPDTGSVMVACGAISTMVALASPIIGLFARPWWLYTLLSAAVMAMVLLLAAAIAGLKEGLYGPALLGLLPHFRLALMTYGATLAVTAVYRFAASVARTGRLPWSLPPGPAGPAPPVVHAAVLGGGLALAAAAFLVGYNLSDPGRSGLWTTSAVHLSEPQLQSLNGRAVIQDRTLAIEVSNETGTLLVDLTIEIARADERPVPQALRVRRDLFFQPWRDGEPGSQLIYLPEDWEGLDVVWRAVEASGLK